MATLAVPASAAASTRSEYVAQLDSTCQSFVIPVGNAMSAYNRNIKEWERRLTFGTLKAWVRQTKRTARSLARFVQIESSVTDQIASVPPPPDDAVTVGTWLNYRRQADAFGRSAASAFARFKFPRYRQQLKRAKNAEAAGQSAISGFGFQVCGVSV